MGIGKNVFCDVLVVGGGLAGASLACALRNSGLRIAVIEARPPAVVAEAWDARIYALSPASQNFLDELGIWEKLDSQRIEAVRDMRIFGDDGVAELEFSAYQNAVDRLATIVEAGAVQRALWEALRGTRDVELLCPETARDFFWGRDACEITLEGGGSIKTRLVVGADGMRSAVRAAAKIDARVDPANQLGVVANFSCSAPHRGTAFQWFREDGVLAWLPLPGLRFSMVWSTDEQHATELLQCGAGELCRRVAQAGRETLGELGLLTEPQAFPLAWMSVRNRVRERLALIGDAAHVVHPLSGQGVNLGFGDARELAVLLRDAAERRADPGELLRLRKFERARAEAILAMRLATKGLKGLFEDRSIAVTKMRNFGLNLIDRAAVIKNLLARHAMD